VLRHGPDGGKRWPARGLECTCHVTRVRVIFKVGNMRKWSFGSRERLWGSAWEFRGSKGTSPHQFDAGDTLVCPVGAGCARNMRESAKSRAWMLGARLGPMKNDFLGLQGDCGTNGHKFAEGLRVRLRCQTCGLLVSSQRYKHKHAKMLGSERCLSHAKTDFLMEAGRVRHVCSVERASDEGQNGVSNSSGGARGAEI
jgi:hypothetical protein